MQQTYVPTLQRKARFSAFPLYEYLLHFPHRRFSSYHSPGSFSLFAYYILSQKCSCIRRFDVLSISRVLSIPTAVQGMGVESGGRGTRPPQSKNQRGTSPEIMIFQYLFLETFANFEFSNIFEIKWPKSEEKLNFGGRWVWMPMNPSPPNKTWWRRPWSKDKFMTVFVEL